MMTNNVTTAEDIWRSSVLGIPLPARVWLDFQFGELSSRAAWPPMAGNLLTCCSRLPEDMVIDI